LAQPLPLNRRSLGCGTSKRRSGPRAGSSINHVLIASSSAFRRRLYQDVLQDLGHRISVAEGGVDCLEQARAEWPDLLLLESSLLWGGSEGVLEVLHEEHNSPAPRTVLIAVGNSSSDWFQLSRFQVDDCLFRTPTAQELKRVVGSVSSHANKTAVRHKFAPERPRIVRPPENGAFDRYL